MWKGPGVPTHEQGIKVLGTPLGHEDFVAAHLESVLTEHHMFLSRIPEVKDVQSAWLLLLHCASARACYLTRVVRPSAVGDFMETHDRTLWQCLSDILKVDPLQCDEVLRDVAKGGLGLRNSGRMRVPSTAQRDKSRSSTPSDQFGFSSFLSSSGRNRCHSIPPTSTCSRRPVSPEGTHQCGVHGKLGTSMQWQTIDHHLQSSGVSRIFQIKIEIAPQNVGGNSSTCFATDPRRDTLHRKSLSGQYPQIERR